MPHAHCCLRSDTLSDPDRMRSSVNPRSLFARRRDDLTKEIFVNARTAFVTIASAAVLTAALLIPAEAASADVATCGTVITTTGTTVTLPGDLYCNGRGIPVRADNVTIDLNGHTIYGTTSPDPVIDPVLGAPAGVTIYN